MRMTRRPDIRCFEGRMGNQIQEKHLDNSWSMYLEERKARHTLIVSDVDEHRAFIQCFQISRGPSHGEVSCTTTDLCESLCLTNDLGEGAVTKVVDGLEVSSHSGAPVLL